jgi:hypothetical protein
VLCSDSCMIQKLRGFPQPHLQIIWAGFIHHTMKHLFKHQSSSWFTTIHRNLYLLYWPRNSYKKIKVRTFTCRASMCSEQAFTCNEPRCKIQKSWIPEYSALSRMIQCVLSRLHTHPSSCVRHMSSWHPVACWWERQSGFQNTCPACTTRDVRCWEP